MNVEPAQRRAALRASDADRERIVSALRQHHADGRLTVEEFTERMHRAFGSKTFGELDLLTQDLPPLPPPLPETPPPDPAAVAKRHFYHHLLSYGWTNAFLVAVWALICLAAGRLLFFWPMWTLLGWGLAVGSHAIRTFGPQDPGPSRYDDRWAPPHRGYRRGGGDGWTRRHRSSRSHVTW